MASTTPTLPAPEILETGPGRNLLDEILFGAMLHILLISIDPEWADRKFYPEDHAAYTKLTELGIAILDPRDIRGVSPGRYGMNWISKICARHFLNEDIQKVPLMVLQYKDSRGALLYAAHNCEFANSEVMPLGKFGPALEKVLKVVDDVAQGGDMPAKDVVAGQEVTSEHVVASKEKAAPAQETEPEKYREIVIVGQGWGDDARHICDGTGLDIGALGTVKAVLDNRNIEKDSETTKTGLHHLMDRYKMNRLHMHNGTNDAVYTLGVMIQGALWRHAIAQLQKGDWSYMNEVFPGLDRNAEEAIKALKECIAKQKGGRCHKCGKFGHVTESCDKSGPCENCSRYGHASGTCELEVIEATEPKVTLSVEEEFMAKGKLLEAMGGRITVAPATAAKES